MGVRSVIWLPLRLKFVTAEQYSNPSRLVTPSELKYKSVMVAMSHWVMMSEVLAMIPLLINTVWTADKRLGSGIFTGKEQATVGLTVTVIVGV